LDALILVICLCLFVITVSYTEIPILAVLVARPVKTPGEGNWRRSVRQGIVANSLHNLLQLHRICLEKTYKLRFRRTTEQVPLPDGTSTVPIYGVKMVQPVEVELPQWPGPREEREIVDPLHHRRTTRVPETGLYATMLEATDQAMEKYDARKLL